MAATREARKREMIANLDNDVYIKALVDEAYATIFTGSTTNTVAQKKVKRIFEAERSPRFRSNRLKSVKSRSCTRVQRSGTEAVCW